LKFIASRNYCAEIEINSDSLLIYRSAGALLKIAFIVTRRRQIVLRINERSCKYHGWKFTHRPCYSVVSCILILHSAFLVFGRYYVPPGSHLSHTQTRVDRKHVVNYDLTHQLAIARRFVARIYTSPIK